MAFVTPVVEHWLEEEIAQWVHHEWMLYYGATSHCFHHCTCETLKVTTIVRYFGLIIGTLKGVW